MYASSNCSGESAHLCAVLSEPLLFDDVVSTKILYVGTSLLKTLLIGPDKQIN